MKESKEDRIGFAKIIKTFQVNCGIDKIEKEQLNLYFTAFKPFTLDEIKAAFQKVLLSWEYNKLPTIGVFMKAIQVDQPQIEDQAEIQAAEVLKQMQVCGSYGTPKFDDPITGELMKHRFKLPNLCRSMKEGEETWFVKEFIGAYKAFSRNKKHLLIETPPELKQIANDLFERIE